MADLARDFWWLAFPLFGMVMAIWGLAQENQRIAADIRRWRRNLEDGL